MVIEGLASPSLLDSYTEERLPVIKDMLRITAELLQRSFDPNRKGGVMDRPSYLHQLGVNYRSSPIVLDEFQDEDTAAKTVTSAYESDKVLRAGARAPEAPKLLDIRSGQETSLFDIFRPHLHTVLIFLSTLDADEDTTATLKALEDLPKGTVQSVIVTPKGSTSVHPGETKPDLIVQDGEGHALAAYDVLSTEGRIVVIRPDGYVGAIVRRADGVVRYFSNIFSAA